MPRYSIYAQMLLSTKILSWCVGFLYMSIKDMFQLWQQLILHHQKIKFALNRWMMNLSSDHVLFMLQDLPIGGLFGQQFSSCTLQDSFHGAEAGTDPWGEVKVLPLHHPSHKTNKKPDSEKQVQMQTWTSGHHKSVTGLNLK